MRVTEAARLIVTGNLSPDILWQMTTLAERVTISLLVGRPDYLPAGASTPSAAWDTLDARYRALVMRRAPVKIRKRLPGYTSAPRPFSMTSGNSSAARHALMATARRKAPDQAISLLSN
ncbi:hypothetical protein [Acetobacter oeni]|uniref:Uncharacterized protein n=1 Tax=Acetobacter oeni TaxID=304077 RepID=A0A511XID5_9PROT|nr:hypothetical protein [Acetobacter oeni]MBB3881433.1 hypothetical protein [Acetobacter oeni]GBR11006.1 hypothetical protein AA21952_3237 [Acetobacter oeni LMG 21952]GEN62710.1 hypothetical protein AOE01nite_09340 [Acetobacter oeni]